MGRFFSVLSPVGLFALCTAFVIGLVLVSESNLIGQGKQREVTKGQPQHSITVKASAINRVETRSVDKLQRFDQPIRTPPAFRPADRPGGSWHWHTRHGWLWFPVGTAPNALIIPEAFVLPQSVVVFEAAPVTVVCPHCGQTFSVTVR